MKIDKNWIFIPLIVALIVIASMNNQQAVAQNSGNSNVMSIASGGSGGTYYYIAAGQAKILGDKLGINISTQSTSGSPVENMTLTSNDKNMMGLVTTDGLYFAGQGSSERGFDKKLENLRVVQVGHVAYLYGVSLKNSKVTSFENMKGNKISIPPVGSTTYYQALAVLNLFGCDESNTQIIPLSASEQSDALRDGLIDVAFMAGGIPQATVTELDHGGDLRFLSLNSDSEAEFKEKYPYWGVSTIPMGTYKSQTEDIKCPSVSVMLACNASLEEDLVFNITKVLNESTDELTDIHTSGREWSLENTIPYLENDTITFHPGALKYYKTVVE